MQNILINIGEQLRNDRALGNRKSDNNKYPKNKHKNKNSVGSACDRPVSRSKKW